MKVFWRLLGRDVFPDGSRTRTYVTDVRRQSQVNALSERARSMSLPGDGSVRVEMTLEGLRTAHEDDRCKGLLIRPEEK